LFVQLDNVADTEHQLTLSDVPVGSFLFYSCTFLLHFTIGQTAYGQGCNVVH